MPLIKLSNHTGALSINLHRNRICAHSDDIAGGMPGRAAADLTPLQHHDVSTPKPGQMPGDAGANDAAADHNDACAGGQTFCHVGISWLNGYG